MQPRQALSLAVRFVPALVAAVAVLAYAPDSRAQSDAPIELQGLTPAEFDALRPLAARGAAVLVRNADEGPRARITILVRARSPIATVRRAITTPEEYITFMPTVSSVDIVSRHLDRVAFRFHISAVIFDVTTLSALHPVGPRRVDVTIVQSDIGPGGSRWDLLPDGDGTLVALTTYGDPSRGNWFLRQVAARSPNAIAGMNISADMILILGLVRRAEILAGLHLPVRPHDAYAPPGPLAPPALGPWTALTHSVVVGSVALTPDGVITQATVAMWSPLAPDALQQRLEDVVHYPTYWHAMRQVEVVNRHDRTVRYRSVIESPISQTRGEEELTTEPTADGVAISWRGVAGDYLGNDHRWDLARDASGGTLVMLTGGSEYARAGFMTRSMMDRDVWLVPGYATSWKLVWMRPLLVSH